MSEDQSSLTGRWTIEEHQKFLLGLQLYGKDWKKIQQLVATRNSSQIRSHAQKYFLKLKKQSKRKLHSSASNSKFSQSEVPSENQTSPIIKNMNCSYFMNKIIEYTRSHENLDIWNALIDSKSPKETVTNLQQSGNSKNMTIQENINQGGEQKFQ